MIKKACVGQTVHEALSRDQGSFGFMLIHPSLFSISLIRGPTGDAVVSDRRLAWLPGQPHPSECCNRRSCPAGAATPYWILTVFTSLACSVHTGCFQFLFSVSEPKCDLGGERPPRTTSAHHYTCVQLCAFVCSSPGRPGRLGSTTVPCYFTARWTGWPSVTPLHYTGYLSCPQNLAAPLLPVDHMIWGP